jgi:hypothetical protein
VQTLGRHADKGGLAVVLRRRTCAELASPAFVIDFDVLGEARIDVKCPALGHRDSIPPGIPPIDLNRTRLG